MIIGPDFSHQSLADYVDIHIDSNHTLTYSDLIQTPPLFESQVPTNLGFSDATIWLRLTPTILPGAPSMLYLELTYPLLDEVTLFYSDLNGQMIQQTLGDHYPSHQRPIHHRNVVFELPTDIQSSSIYLRIKTTSSLIFSMNLWTPESFNRKSINEFLILGMYYGFLLVMILYNLFLAVTLSDKNYYFYVLFISFYGLFQASHNGVLPTYVLTTTPWASDTFIVTFNALATLGGLLFTYHFLEIKRFSLLLHRIGLCLIGIAIIQLIVALLLPYSIAIAMGIIVPMASVIFVYAAGIVTLINGYKPARIYLIAWTTLLAGILIHSLRTLALIPDTFFTRHMFQIGTAIEVILHYLALSDRIKLIESEKTSANEQALIHKHRAIEEKKLSEQLKNEFIFAMSHDLKNQIIGLKLYLNTTIRDDVTESDEFKPIFKSLTDIHTNLNHYLLHEGTVKTIQIIDVLTQLIDEYQTIILSKRITVSSQLDPSIIWTGNPFKLRQALVNIIENALTYSPQGGTICISLTSDSSTISISISDHGCGIPTHKQSSLFTKPITIDTESESDHTGYGLFISHEIIRSYGGSIVVNTALNEGTTVRISLPSSKKTKG